MDAWYLGPSADHYQYNFYYAPETRAYRILGSAELFPQHCQVPNLSNYAHLKALTEELETSTGIAAQTHKGRMLIKQLGKAIKTILKPPVVSEQRVVGDNISEVMTQRANDDSAPEITRISDALAIMNARDPTSKRNLVKNPCTHRRLTRNNTPGAVPAIQRVALALILPEKQPARATRRSPRVNTNEGTVIIIPPYRMLGGGTRASPRLISQQVLIAMTIREALTPPRVFTPQKFVPVACKDNVPNFAHFASPMFHPTTGEIISSFKRLMNDPETAEVWQTAFRKISAEWHRETIKRARMGRIRCLS